MSAVKPSATAGALNAAWFGAAAGALYGVLVGTALSAVAVIGGVSEGSFPGAGSDSLLGAVMIGLVASVVAAIVGFLLGLPFGAATTLLSRRRPTRAPLVAVLLVAGAWCLLGAPFVLGGGDGADAAASALGMTPLLSIVPAAVLHGRWVRRAALRREPQPVVPGATHPG